MKLTERQKELESQLTPYADLTERQKELESQLTPYAILLAKWYDDTGEDADYTNTALKALREVVVRSGPIARDGLALSGFGYGAIHRPLIILDRSKNPRDYMPPRWCLR